MLPTNCVNCKNSLVKAADNSCGKANFYESKMYKLLVIFALLTVGGTAAHKNQA
jgi:hypothetical protein